MNFVNLSSIHVDVWWSPIIKNECSERGLWFEKNRLSSLKAFRFAEDPDNHRSSRVKQDWDQCSNNSDKNATKFSSFFKPQQFWRWWFFLTDNFKHKITPLVKVKFSISWNFFRNAIFWRKLHPLTNPYSLLTF